MASVPDLGEIAATVSRMESRFDALREAAPLMEAYRRVSERFDTDLADPRDLALSRGAALMLVKDLLGENRA